MAPQSFITEWNAGSGVLEVAASPTRDAGAGLPTPAGTGTDTVPAVTVAFRAVAAVAFAADGRVCAVDVPDLPEDVVPAIPPGRGRDESVGFAWLDSGWLWIPLSPDRAARQRSGPAEIELRLCRDEVAGLSLRFLDQETST
ncbi:hypothetical protein [Streptomyces sp. NPDC089919]|uniref:hypothetical protein n=1 Tax=Streptomyces sp. NPDC089919 TaxID=3155188 RepID=UPI00342C3992